MKAILVLFLTTVWLMQSGKASLSSVDKLATTLDLEKNVVGAMEEVSKLMKKHFSVIQTYTENYAQIRSLGVSSIDLVSHPINGFLIMKRLVRGWKELENVKTKMKALLTDAFADLNNYRADVEFPNEHDFNITSESIILLENTYDLDVKELSKGWVRDIRDKSKVFNTTWKLSAWDCMHLGNKSTSMQRYGSAVSWYQAALRRRQEEEDSTGTQQINKLLQDAIKQHDTILLRVGPRGDDWSTYDQPFNQYLAQRDVYRKEVHTKWHPKLYQEVSDAERETQWEKLCRGDILQPSSLRERLSCFYARDTHPYFLLRPLKVEEHSQDPYIAVIHEFMSDNETEKVIKTGSKKLGPSTYYNEEGERVTGVYRTSLNAWLKSVSITDKISQRIQSALAVDVTRRNAAEQYQVANYGVGGRYYVHHDFLQDVKDYYESKGGSVYGDRIITFMVYLTDVESGGATIFPRAGVTVWPKRGSAAVWFNLFKNGEGDEDTLHGGCPVIYGTKWIANKWVYSNNQMHTARCSTEYYEKFDGRFWNAKQRDAFVRVFMQYNTPLRCSAAVERLFSMASDVLRAKRSSLTAENFENLLFLKGNMDLIESHMAKIVLVP